MPDSVPSPKLREDLEFSSPYRYYAGFSEQFAVKLLGLAGSLGPKVTAVLDPWNGSGTTTRAAARLGLSAVGVDLNPAMVVVAKARIANSLDDCGKFGWWDTIAAEGLPLVVNEEPLRIWFDESSAGHVRRIAARIAESDSVEPSSFPSQSSTRACQLMVALFLTVKQLAQPFQGTNPTWFRMAKTAEARLSLSESQILETFRNNVRLLKVNALPARLRSPIQLVQGDSRALPEFAKGATVILTSPPYCTRIDYAVATSPELATLGLTLSRQQQLRRSLIGTTTVPNQAPKVEPGAAFDLLQAVRTHSSKASASYYHKWLLQYFDSLGTSLQSLTSAASPKSILVMVLQDSWYKDVHIQLPSLTTTMLGDLGWEARERYLFPAKSTRTTMNPNGRAYRSSSPATEEVLIFSKS